MKRSTLNKLARMLSLLLATGISVLVARRALGQQEVNPTWYDPWPTVNKDVSESSRARAAKKKGVRKLEAVASKPVPPKTPRGSAYELRNRNHFTKTNT